MLTSMKELMNCRLVAKDGKIGMSRDFYFDDFSWAVRYIVVQTGSWFHRVRTLLSPAAVESTDWILREMYVTLTREQLRKGPDVNADRPISRQREEGMPRYLRWPAHRGAPTPENEALEILTGPNPPGGADPHLRSAAEVGKYTIKALDGPVGRVTDFILNPSSWVIFFIVAESQDTHADSEVFIATEWVDKIDLAKKKVYVLKNRKSISSPENKPKIHIERIHRETNSDNAGPLQYWL